MDDLFRQFWAAYPKRVARGIAHKAFLKAIKKVTLSEMLDALDWQRRQTAWIVDGGKYIPHPATWLNQERWADEPTEAPQISAASAGTLKSIYES